MDRDVIDCDKHIDINSQMDINRRIEQLEKRNRRNTLLLIGLLITAVTALGAAQATSDKPSDRIETKDLRIFDQDGALRAFITSRPSGNVGLALLDQSEKVCLVLGVGSNGNPSIELSHSDGKLRARVALADNGDPVLEFYNTQGQVTSRLPLPK